MLYLRDKAAVGAGTTVLVIGASGAVGSNAVQIATSLGATVTGVTSARNADLVKQLGATRVVDYNTTDPTSLDERFDVVIDTVGTLSIAAGRRLLNDGGKLKVVLDPPRTLDQTVDAYRIVDTGRTIGNIVVCPHAG